MRSFQIAILNAFLAAFLVAGASAQDVQRDSSDKPSNRDPVSRESRSKGDVDALLEKLKKKDEKVLETCLENCGSSKESIREKPSPEYPAKAKERRIGGKVVVRVVVDEQGKVMAAQAVSGPVLLRESSVVAARQTRFRPSLLSGQPVKVSGVITYNFALQ